MNCGRLPSTNRGQEQVGGCPGSLEKDVLLWPEDRSGPQGRQLHSFLLRPAACLLHGGSAVGSRRAVVSGRKGVSEKSCQLVRPLDISFVQLLGKDSFVQQVARASATPGQEAWTGRMAKELRRPIEDGCLLVADGECRTLRETF